MPYQDRIKNAQNVLRELNIEAVIVTSPANFYYFSGIWLDSDERIQAIVISEAQDQATMVVHEMSKEEVFPANHFKKKFWKDGENAIAIIEKLLPHSGIVSIDNLWQSHHLLELMKIAKNVEFTPSTHVLGQLRLIKDKTEIGLLKRSGKVADEVMEQTINFIKPGLRESEVVDEIKRLFAERGVEDLSFNPIVGAGKHGAIPHHTPGADKIVDGDMIVLDLGGIKNHYCSDITRTIVVGEPTDEMVKVYDIVRRAQEKAFQAVKPGIPLKEIDLVARNVISEAGYGDYFTHRTGHGLGIQVHEEPYVTSVNEQLLEEGMVISIEPGIYLEGQFGVRIEDIVVVTSEGGQRINNVSLDLVQK